MHPWAERERQREREREGKGGWQERRALLPPKCYKMHKSTGGQREGEGERRGREGVRRAPSQVNVGMCVSLQPAHIIH